MLTMREMIRELTVAMARAEKRQIETVLEPGNGVEARFPYPPPSLPPQLFQEQWVVELSSQQIISHS